MVAGTGALARWWRVPRLLIVVVQVLLAGMVASMFICGSPLPVGDAWDRLITAFTDAAQSANRFAPRCPRTEPPVHPLLISGGLACLLLVDILACTLRRVPAGRPAAAHHLQRAGEHDRRRAALGPLHAHRDRLPGA